MKINPALTDLDLVKLAAGLGNHFTSVEATSAYLDRIDRHDEDIHSFVDVFHEEALQFAARMDAELHAGHRRSPLHGIPIAVKDLIDIANRVTTAGSAVYRHRKAETTAPVIQRLRDAGMVILGKVHTVELALGGWGVNPTLGTPANAWRRDTLYSPGGSSSGSGAAVAARLAPIALGTDTGGSVRIPASFCGLTGLKPTWGYISTEGIVPLSRSLDSVGPLAHSVEDAASLVDLLANNSASASLVAAAKSAQVEQRSLRGVTVGRIGQTDLDGCEVDVINAYEQSIIELAAAGATVTQARLPMPLREYSRLTGVLSAEAFAEHGKIALDTKTNMDPVIRQRVLNGNIPADEYLKLFWSRGPMAKAFIASLGHADVLVTPTTPMVAKPIAEIDENVTPAQLTRFVNLLGFCAIALPNGLSRDTLPTSIQIVGKPHHETQITRIAAALQARTDWHHLMPTGLPGR